MAKKSNETTQASQTSANTIPDYNYWTGGGSGSSIWPQPQWTTGYPTVTTGSAYNPNANMEAKLDQLIALMMQMTQRLEDLVAILES